MDHSVHTTVCSFRSGEPNKLLYLKIRFRDEESKMLFGCFVQELAGNCIESRSIQACRPWHLLSMKISALPR